MVFVNQKEMLGYGKRKQVQNLRQLDQQDLSPTTVLFYSELYQICPGLVEVLGRLVNRNTVRKKAH